MDDDEAEHLDQDSYYATLNVPKDASEEDIKKSYRHLAQVCHPDKAPSADSREEAAANFMRIQEAYEVACDPGCCSRLNDTTLDSYKTLKFASLAGAWQRGEAGYL